MMTDLKTRNSGGSVGCLAQVHPGGFANPRAGGFSPRGRSSGAAFSLRENPRGLKPAAQGAYRRRGNIMLFVIFILGTLFAASMAFLALMRTEAGVMTSRRNQTKLDVIFGGLSDDLLLGVADSLMGRGVILTGPDGDPCAGNDEILVGRIPYVQVFADCEGDPISGGFDLLADNPDMMVPYAMTAGVHPLLASLDPYSSGLPGTASLGMEYSAVTSWYPAWDAPAAVPTATGRPRTPHARRTPTHAPRP